MQLPVLSVRQRGVVKARDEGAERPHAREHGVVHDLRRPLRRGEIVREGRKAQLVPKRAGDGRKIRAHGGSVRPRERRERHSAVAADERGQTLRQLGTSKIGAEQRRVGVAVDVQKAGRQRAALRVKNVRGIGVGQTTDRGNGSVLDANVGGKSVRAGAVEHLRAANEPVQHGLTSPAP